MSGWRPARVGPAQVATTGVHSRTMNAIVLSAYDDADQPSLLWRLFEPLRPRPSPLHWQQASSGQPSMRQLAGAGQSESSSHRQPSEMYRIERTVTGTVRLVPCPPNVPAHHSAMMTKSLGSKPCTPAHRILVVAPRPVKSECYGPRVSQPQAGFEPKKRVGMRLRAQRSALGHLRMARGHGGRPRGRVGQPRA